MDPAETAMLDQTAEGVAAMLQRYGVDRRDPAAMKGALAALQLLTFVFHETPGGDRDGMVRGLLYSLGEMQPK
jgi:hypothetical protein